MSPLDQLKSEIFSEFPHFQVIEKQKSFKMKAINVFLKIITFGQMKTFMVDFVTTVGQKVYVPTKWATWPEKSKLTILRHERVHMRQAQKYGRFLFSFLYLFFPFPTLVAYYRMKFEREAYTESLVAMAEYFGKDYLNDQRVKESMFRHFTSSEYFWMWPWKKSLEKWYSETLAKL